MGPVRLLVVFAVLTNILGDGSDSEQDYGIHISFEREVEESLSNEGLLNVVNTASQVFHVPSNQILTSTIYKTTGSLMLHTNGVVSHRKLRDSIKHILSLEVGVTKKDVDITFDPDRFVVYEYSAEICGAVQDLLRDTTVQKRLSHEIASTVAGMISVEFQVDDPIICRVNMHIDDSGSASEDTVENAEALSDQMEVQGWTTEYYTDIPEKTTDIPDLSVKIILMDLEKIVFEDVEPAALREVATIITHAYSRPANEPFTISGDYSTKGIVRVATTGDPSSDQISDAMREAFNDAYGLEDEARIVSVNLETGMIMWSIDTTDFQYANELRERMLSESTQDLLNRELHMRLPNVVITDLIRSQDITWETRLEVDASKSDDVARSNQDVQTQLNQKGFYVFSTIASVPSVSPSVFISEPTKHPTTSRRTIKITMTREVTESISHAEQRHLMEVAEDNFHVPRAGVKGSVVYKSTGMIQVSLLHLQKTRGGSSLVQQVTNAFAEELGMDHRDIFVEELSAHDEFQITGNRNTADLLYILNAASQEDAADYQTTCAGASFSNALSQQTGHSCQIETNEEILVDVTLLVDGNHTPDISSSEASFQSKIEPIWDIVIDEEADTHSVDSSTSTTSTTTTTTQRVTTTTATTKSPTNFPTTSTTTKRPTKFPTTSTTTQRPSDFPIFTPSKHPSTSTSRPTKPPTFTPSKNPSTSKPTKHPTAFPTFRPSSTTTTTSAAPTHRPSVKTVKPSISPSVTGVIVKITVIKVAAHPIHHEDMQALQQIVGQEFRFPPHDVDFETAYATKGTMRVDVPRGATERTIQEAFINAMSKALSIHRKYISVYVHLENGIGTWSIVSQSFRGARDVQRKVFEIEFDTLDDLPGANVQEIRFVDEIIVQLSTRLLVDEMLDLHSAKLDLQRRMHAGGYNVNMKVISTTAIPTKRPTFRKTTQRPTHGHKNRRPTDFPTHDIFHRHTTRTPRPSHYPTWKHRTTRNPTTHTNTLCPTTSTPTSAPHAWSYYHYPTITPTKRPSFYRPHGHHDEPPKPNGDTSHWDSPGAHYPPFHPDSGRETDDSKTAIGSEHDPVFIVLLVLLLLVCAICVGSCLTAHFTGHSITKQQQPIPLVPDPYIILPDSAQSFEEQERTLAEIRRLEALAMRKTLQNGRHRNNFRAPILLKDRASMDVINWSQSVPNTV